MILTFFFSLVISAQAKIIDKTSIKNKTSPPSVEQNSVAEVGDPSESLGRYFSENNCVSILKYFKDKDFRSVKPLELALAASCEPPGKDPEKMFAFAEKRDPKDDVILLLHGRYRWKKYKVSAAEVWQKLIDQTQNETLVDLAKQYLLGNDREAEAKLTGKDPHASFLQVGFIRESNPSQFPKSDSLAGANASDGAIWNISSAPRNDYDFGFVDWNTTFSGTQYSTAPEANFALIDFSPQLSLQSSLEQFFIIKPGVSAFSLDGRLFYGRLGLSLGEIWNYPNLELSLLATLAGDRYYVLGAQDQSGTHYIIESRISTKWKSSIFSFGLLWDKNNAGEDSSAAGLVIPYTNNTASGFFSYQWIHKDFSAGFNSTISGRQDEVETQYTDALSVAQTKKRRDITFNLGPWVSWKWTPRLTSILFYSANKVTSNFNEADLLDRNIDNSVVGIILKSNF